MDKLLQPDLDKINQAAAFINQFSSIILGTRSATNQPHTSYAPYISNKGDIYVYVSALAQHFETLKQGSACGFFIEEEANANNIFARTRLTLNCRVEEINDAQTLKTKLDLFEQMHGSTIQVLRGLPDFSLFKLSPERAIFVTGFGAAYDMNASLGKIIP